MHGDWELGAGCDQAEGKIQWHCPWVSEVQQDRCRLLGGCLLQVLWCGIPWENPGSDISKGEKVMGTEEAPSLEQRDELCLAIQT